MIIWSLIFLPLIVFCIIQIIKENQKMNALKKETERLKNETNFKN